MFARDSTVLRDDIKIQNTMRVMPEDQNSGGFYIALLRKNAPVTLRKTEGKAGEVADDKDVSDAETKDAQKIKLNDGSSLLANPAPAPDAAPQVIKIEKEKKKKQNGYAVPKMDYTPFAEKFNDAWVAIRDMYGFDDVTLPYHRTSRTIFT